MIERIDQTEIDILVNQYEILQDSKSLHELVDFICSEDSYLQWESGLINLVDDISPKTQEERQKIYTTQIKNYLLRYKYLFRNETKFDKFQQEFIQSRITEIQDKRISTK